MTNEEFCRLHSAYNGEKITNIKQLVSEVFNGEELKEFVDFCIEQSKLSQHDVSGSIIANLEAIVYSLSLQYPKMKVGEFKNIKEVKDIMTAIAVLEKYYR